MNHDPPAPQSILLAPVAGLALASPSPRRRPPSPSSRSCPSCRAGASRPRPAYNAWNSARLNQAAWTEYAFDWSTDYCSTSPDQPLGFDFRLPCRRHDFGYRNYRAIGQFPANKSRIDDAFYFDLRAKCATYNVFVRRACYSLAWTYYQAVQAFGGLA